MILPNSGRQGEAAGRDLTISSQIKKRKLRGLCKLQKVTQPGSRRISTHTRSAAASPALPLVRSQPRPAIPTCLSSHGPLPAPPASTDTGMSSRVSKSMCLNNFTFPPKPVPPLDMLISTQVIFPITQASSLTAGRSFSLPCSQLLGLRPSKNSLTVLPHICPFFHHPVVSSLILAPAHCLSPNYQIT